MIRRHRGNDFLARYDGGMSEVTKILAAIDAGDAAAADKLLPLVYDELRELAGNRLLRERSEQSLDATALVHEAYLRLLGCQLPKLGRQGAFLRLGRRSDATNSDQSGTAIANA